MEYSKRSYIFKTSFTLEVDLYMETHPKALILAHWKPISFNFII